MTSLDRAQVLAHYRQMLRDAQREQANKLLKADPDYPDYPIHHDDWTAGNEQPDEE